MPCSVVVPGATYLTVMFCYPKHDIIARLYISQFSEILFFLYIMLLPNLCVLKMI
uniref:Uncharacterized protein n=1 Tax=Arundo donax TaxID=35708 RepID=A0A0A8Y0S9_ARUDO